MSALQPELLDSDAQPLGELSLVTWVGGCPLLPSLDGTGADANPHGEGGAGDAQLVPALLDRCHMASIAPAVSYCKCRDILLRYMEEGGAAQTTLPMADHLVRR